MTFFALRGGSGIVKYIYFKALGLPGIDENKVLWVGEQ